MELEVQAGEQGVQGSVRFKVDTALPIPGDLSWPGSWPTPSQRVCLWGSPGLLPSLGSSKSNPVSVCLEA